MRILTKQQFLKLPAGTIFSEYEPCIFRGLKVKGESLEEISDFTEAGLIGRPESTDSDDFMRMCEKMEKGGNVPLEVDAFGREGYFDDGMFYAVLDREDTEKIIGVLKDNPNE